LSKFGILAKLLLLVFCYK